MKNKNKDINNFLNCVPRPKERISEIMLVLNQIWQIQADLRLGQLIYNIVPVERLFNIEDDELLDILQKYYNELINKTELI